MLQWFQQNQLLKQPVWFEIHWGSRIPMDGLMQIMSRILYVPEAWQQFLSIKYWRFLKNMIVLNTWIWKLMQFSLLICSLTVKKWNVKTFSVSKAWPQISKLVKNTPSKPIQCILPKNANQFKSNQLIENKHVEFQIQSDFKSLAIEPVVQRSMAWTKILEIILS